jgi:hypothetical protein
MKLIYLFAFALLIAIQAFGQYEVNSSPVEYKRGYVYLKNGSVLKGRYIYSDSMEKLRLNSGRNTWIFDVSEIDKVSKMRPGRFNEADPEFRSVTFAPPKWFNLTELGILAGNSDNSQSAPLVFCSSVNRKVYKNLSAGIGIGAEFLKETYLPVTANILYRLHDSRFTPYAMLQAGYQIPVEDSRTLYYQVVPDYIYSSTYIGPGSQSEMKARGGFMINPSFGLMKQTSSGFGMCLSFGYRFHRLHYTSKDDYRLDIDFNRLSIKLGFIIN